MEFDAQGFYREKNDRHALSNVAALGGRLNDHHVFSQYRNGVLISSGGN